jgi:hypothetical protein
MKTGPYVRLTLWVIGSLRDFGQTVQIRHALAQGQPLFGALAVSLGRPVDSESHRVGGRGFLSEHRPVAHIASVGLVVRLDAVAVSRVV